MTEPTSSILAPRKSRPATFTRLVPLLVLHAAVFKPGSLHRGYYRGPLAQIVALVISIFTAPYWGHVGDIKGRLVPLYISVIGRFLGTIIAPDYGGQYDIVAGIVEGLAGGPATFYGAVFSYIVDVSSAKNLLPKFSIAVAIQLLAQFFPNYRGPTNAPTVIVYLILCAYIYFFIGESRPVPIRLEVEDEDQEEPEYDFPAFLKAVKSTLKGNTPLILSLVSASLLFSAEPLAQSIYVSRFNYNEYTLMELIFPAVRILTLLIFALVISWVQARRNVASVAKALSISSAASLTTAQIGCLIGFIIFLTPLTIAFDAVRVFAAPLTPSLLALLYFVWNGEKKNRGSFVTTILLIHVVFSTIGAALAAFPWRVGRHEGDFEGHRVLTIVFGAVTTGLASFGLFLLAWVRVPPQEELEAEEE
ncbi:hypothetical protein DL96DRAFT_1705798 [Flagelloscypha sp. PMI_526]|nr:hypothetical protein DL96DRAFT_1705798 [Flagelloscypha sp. PMI_526]